MKYRGVIFLIALFILVQTTIAFNFNITITPDVKAIKTNESANFDLILFHNSKDTESFSIYSPDINWDIVLDKYPYLIQGSHELKLSVRPLNIQPGIYNIPIFVKATSTNDVIKKYIGIELSSATSEIVGRLPALRTKLDFPAKIDPRIPTKLILTLENKNNRRLDNVIVKIRSDLINEDHTTSLDPFEIKQVDFTINFPEKTSPKSDLLKITLFFVEEEKTYRQDLDSSQYSIIQYGGVSVNESTDKGWFAKRKIIKFFNTGNTLQPVKFNQSLAFFEELFTSYTFEPENNEWIFDLGVSEERIIEIYTSFIPLVVLAVIFLLLLFAYFFFRSPIVIVKRTQILKTTEGGISKLKVLLYLKNRSSKNIRNIHVLDVIPRLADFVEKQYEGTLNPVMIKRLEKGTLLKWYIDVLEPSEERVIYYKVINKVSILEGLSLPVAVAKFNVVGNVERSTKSNVVEITI